MFAEAHLRRDRALGDPYHSPLPFSWRQARQATWMNRAPRSVNPFRYFGDDDDSGDQPGLNGTAPVVDSV